MNTSKSLRRSTSRERHKWLKLTNLLRNRLLSLWIRWLSQATSAQFPAEITMDQMDARVVNTATSSMPRDMKAVKSLEKYSRPTATRTFEWTTYKRYKSCSQRLLTSFRMLQSKLYSNLCKTTILKYKVLILSSSYSLRSVLEHLI